MNKEETLRNRIFSYLEKNIEDKKCEVVAHFKKEGVSKTTIYDIINRFQQGMNVTRKKGSGRTPKIMTKPNINMLKRLTNHQVGNSQRKLARKFNCHQSYISKTLKRKTKIVIRKREKIPQRTDPQKACARPKCSTLLRKYKNKKWILDDESYFTLSHSTINGNVYYYSDDKNATPPDIKYRTKPKFEKKLLVWLALSPSGMSKPLFLPCGEAITMHTYVDECLKARLLPFIKKYHSDGEYVFWPDLASSHYGEDSLDFLIENGIHHVDKGDNPANLPECRAIEDFWSILKGKVYENNWEAKTLDELKDRIVFCLNKVDRTSIQRLIEGTTKRLARVKRFNIIEKQK